MNEDVQYPSLELARVRMFLDITMDRLHDTEESLTSTLRSFQLLKQKYNVDLKHHVSSLMEELKERTSAMAASIQQGHEEILSQVSENHTLALTQIQNRYNDMCHSESSKRVMIQKVEDLKKQAMDESLKIGQLQDVVQSIRTEYNSSLQAALLDLQTSYDTDRTQAVSQLESLLRHVPDD